ncbi:ArsC/Spx/MgsR family protein [Phaeobacter sp. B1627]|uniref:ArsC/Spx/MgsR family protein n=1 Tax=Phaeobacter sp. B1627 TaxID=2583809 RepID=UPI00111B8E7D|nr:ArsC/Spx/MgsR family protein [Phaeobacter sp. B1627]TNJ48229.1 arsenate reductase [Phaeobacter sp. B1627]
MKLYGLKTCDTCRKALKSLPDAVFVDVRKEGVPEEIMKQASAQFPDKLLNTRSTTWRELSAEERERPQPELLAAYPSLMKRPLIEADGQLYLGWTAEVKTALGVG